MRLERASFKAVSYSCLNFHYAKRLPAQPIIGFNVFEADVWCGCVVFNAGVRGIEKPYNLHQGEVSELARVALNGKQSFTSKSVGIAIRLLKKSNPLIKLLVSYADSDENHNGTIYQAMNWYFVGSKHTSNEYIDPITGKSIHSRSMSKSGFKTQFGVLKKVKKKSDLVKVIKGVKHKYIYPLDKSLIPMCEELSKPYPKKTNAHIA